VGARFDVCITSYPGRFYSLVEVLKGLGKQSLYPNRVFVFLHSADVLEIDLTCLTGIPNLSLFLVPDFGPGTKLLPRLAMGHDRPIVVLDDDLVYDSNLLRDLVDAHKKTPNVVIGSRAHRVVRDVEMNIVSYREWDWECQDTNPSWDIFPTSGHGTLYPPGCFAPSVLDTSAYLLLSRHTDDLWYYFHTRIAGSENRRLPGVRPVEVIEGTQDTALWGTGNQQRNDINIRLLIQEYGDPESPRRISRMEKVQLLVQRVSLLSQVRRVRLSQTS
jgi:protein O-GlcNAc transferase